MTFPLNEMYGYSRLCDRLRSSAIIWKQVSLRSSAIVCDPRSSAIVCDHMETSLYCKRNEVCCNQLRIFICCPFTFFAYQCRITLEMVEHETRTSQALKGHKIHHNLSTKTRFLLRLQKQNIQATIKEFCRPVL